MTKPAGPEETEARKAWKGAPPRNDEEARERIIQGAIACIKREGASGANISAVAKEVGVTRRTIYRLFDSTEALIQTTSTHSTGKILSAMVAHANEFESFQERVVESMLFSVRIIPTDPVLRAHLLPAHSKKIKIDDAFTEPALDFSYQMLKMIYPGSTKDLSEDIFRQLAEHMQRIVLVLILAPSKSLESEEAKRDYLWRWLVPAVEDALGLTPVARPSEQASKPSSNPTSDPANDSAEE